MPKNKKELVAEFDLSLWKNGNYYHLVPQGEHGCDHGIVVQDFTIKVVEVNGEMKVKVKR